MEQHSHYIIHKPLGVLSQFVNNQNTRRNKRLLGELGTFAEGTMAIGRLDQDSEGLLLLTTDGKTSEIIRRKHIEKEYYAQVDGIITDEDVVKMKAGVEISIHGKKYMTLPCKAHRLENAPSIEERSKRIRGEQHGPTSWVSVTLTEGKFRQVRKMTAAVGFPTLRLIRVRIDHIQLNNLEAGGVIEIDDFNIS